MMSEAFSATIIVGILVLLHGIVGMIEASTTLSLLISFTLKEKWHELDILLPPKKLHFSFNVEGAAINFQD